MTPSPAPTTCRSDPHPVRVESDIMLIPEVLGVGRWPSAITGPAPPPRRSWRGWRAGAPGGQAVVRQSGVPASFTWGDGRGRWRLRALREHRHPLPPAPTTAQPQSPGSFAEAIRGGVGRAAGSTSPTSSFPDLLDDGGGSRPTPWWRCWRQACPWIASASARTPTPVTAVDGEGRLIELRCAR